MEAQERTLGEETDLDSAARHLVAARRDRREIDRLPEGCRPASSEEALVVQRRVVELLGDEIGGYKVSLPRGDDLLVAPLLASRICRESPCRVIAHNGMARIEPEIAFVMGADLPPRSSPYRDEEVKEAVGETRLVLELIASRYEDPSAVPWPELLADSFNNLGLLLGPELEDPFGQELASFRFTVEGLTGEVLARDGRHPNGHPLGPLVWLANFLSGRGEALEAGHIVTTGSYAGVLRVPIVTPLILRFGELGRISARLEPERG